MSLFSSSKPTSTQVSSIACLGLTTQMMFMYMGTIARRTLHEQEPSLEWLYPEFSAVHFVIRDAFAIRDNLFVKWLRKQPLWITQAMTVHAMMAESSALIWWLSPQDSIWRFIGFLSTLTFHFGLLVATRLPNWQIIAMVASTLWIPTYKWSSMLQKSNLDAKIETDTPEAVVTVPTSRLYKIVTRFFYGYMIYNFLGERGWIAKHDGGDIGELFRISQFWVMYSPPPIASSQMYVIGYQDEEHWVDVLQGFKTGKWTWQHNSMADIDLQYSTLETVVSPRWERALDEWSRSEDLSRTKIFLQRLCHHVPHEVNGFFYIMKYWKIVPPGAEGRWILLEDADNKVIEPLHGRVECKKKVNDSSDERSDNTNSEL